MTVDTHNARYTISESDTVEAARFVALKRLFSRPLLPVFVGLLVIFALLAMIDGQRTYMAIALILVLASPIAFFIVVWWLVPWQAKRHYHQAVALAEEISTDWSDKGIGYASTHGNSRFQWSDYHGWAETANLLILFQSESFYNLVPKRALQLAEVEAIKRRLIEAEVSEV